MPLFFFFKSPCCGKVVPCRLCHDEIVTSHVLNRYEVKSIKCVKCETVQEVRKDCEKCGVVFGNYFCSICRLYDDDTSKNQFHCDKCGLCRVGGQDNFFHCEKCDMCLGIKLKEKHKCVEKASRSNCPVCMEDMHTSTAALHVPKCSHMIHGDCYEGCLRSGNYACPICGESLVEMNDIWKRVDEEVANTEMPEEYRNTYIYSLCRDCHQVTKALFHVLGQKCQQCGSYNTCRSDEPNEVPPQAEHSK